jgi:integrase
MTMDALVRQTRTQHRSNLAAVQEYVQEHPTAASFPLGAVVAQAMTERGHQRKWQWQTLHRSMCSTVGAFSNLPLYSNCDLTVSLSACPWFRACLSYVQQRAQESQPRNQTAVTQEQIEVAVEESPHLWIRTALVLMWLTSARVGCVLQLRMQDVSFAPGPATNSTLLRVHFAHGKGVKMRGPYTVFATLAEGPWRDLLTTFVALRRAEGARQSDLLLPATPLTPAARRTSTLLAAVRAADPALNLRAMRRGSLQTVMQQEGVSVEQLMLRAGHTNPKTTRRYLSFGMQDREAQLASSPQTLPLQPSFPRGPPPDYSASL